MRARHTSLVPTPAVKLGQQEFRQLPQVMERPLHLAMGLQRRRATGHLHQAMELPRLGMEELHQHQHTDSPQLKTPMRSTSNLDR